MFTCPDKEIHSVYLDGELPFGLAHDYEAHVASCPSCQKEQARLRRVHDMLAQDSSLIKIDSNFTEQSWERLNARRKYHLVIERTRPSFGEGFGRALQRAIPAAAAAAVLAVVLPLRMTRGSESQMQNESDRETALLASVNGTTPQSGILPKFDNMPFSNSAEGGAWNMGQNASFYNSSNGFQRGGAGFSNGTGNFPHNRHGIHSTQIFDGAGAPSPLLPDIAAVDVFRPDLGDEDKMISIRISVPGIDGEKAYTTIRIPVSALKE